MEIIGRGAEAIVVRTKDGVRKERVAKGYRHPRIDERLREQRTKMEARILARASRAGVPVPGVEQVDEATLLLEEIEGTLLKEVLDEDPHLARQVGTRLARLHDANLIHADLTTSNMIVGSEGIVIIDFGLSYHSTRDEDKAVDLHLFRQSLESKHHRVLPAAWRSFLAGYRESPKSEQVLHRLSAVERRGRNKGS